MRNRNVTEREDGYGRQVVGLLDKPDGDLLGLAAMLKHMSSTNRWPGTT